MPYIKQARRPWLRLDDVDGIVPENVGELNFAITTLIKGYVETHGGPGYEIYNAMVGVAECVKLEMYRKMIAKYEDLKCAENGEVYE